MIKLTLKEY